MNSRNPEKNGLPTGWTITPLEHIADINPRHPKNLNDSVPVTFVPMAALSESRWSFQFSEQRPLGEVRKGYTHFAEGDVLFAKITPCMENGKAALAIGLKNGLGCGTTELHILRPCSRIEAKYLYHFVHQESFRKEAARKFTGTAGQLRVPASFVRNAEIPLPPINEQRRIVVKLEKLLAKVESCQERLNKIPILLKRFRQSVLASACSGRLTADWQKHLQIESSNPTHEIADDLPSSWIWKSIRDLASAAKGSIRSGPFGSNLLHSEFQSTGILAIGIDNVLDGKFSFGRQHRISSQKYETLKKYAARPLDVLVTVMATVGRCCVVPADIETAIITKHVYRITINQIIVNPYFLMHCIRGCPAVLAQVQGEIQGVTRPGINGTILKEIRIPLPPLMEQQEIVRRIETLFKIADQIEERYNKAKAYVDKLTQSILAKAFRGELVPQDQKDEPASVLLKRIRALKSTDAPISNAVHTRSPKRKA